MGIRVPSTAPRTCGRIQPYCINSIYNALWWGAETWQNEGLNGRNRALTRRFTCRSSPLLPFSSLRRLSNKNGELNKH
ncbi:hypothetical protein DPMN_006418, partial [Dreissena polymorpha]